MVWCGIVWSGVVLCGKVVWYGGGWSLCPPPNPYSISSFLHPIAKTEAILSPQKTEYSLKDIWPIIQSYDLNLCIIIIIFMRACYTWFRRIKIGGWETPGNCRPLSVSFQFRASGKESHSQAGSTRKLSKAFHFSWSQSCGHFSDGSNQPQLDRCASIQLELIGPN